MIRCAGCGIALTGDRALATHLMAVPRCLKLYRDHTILYQGQEAVYGTLHLDDCPSQNTKGKWRVYGVDRFGSLVELRRATTREAGLKWINKQNKKAR